MTNLMLIAACLAAAFFCVAFLHGFLEGLLTGLRDLFTVGALSEERAKTLYGYVMTFAKMSWGAAIAGLLTWRPLGLLAGPLALAIAIAMGVAATSVWWMGRVRFHRSRMHGGFGPEDV